MSAHENMKMEMDPNITPRQFYKYKDMLKVFINRLIVLEADYQNFYSYKYSGTSSTISFNYTCRDADIIMNDNKYKNNHKSVLENLITSVTLIDRKKIRKKDIS